MEIIEKVEQFLQDGAKINLIDSLRASLQNSWFWQIDIGKWEPYLDMDCI